MGHFRPAGLEQKGMQIGIAGVPQPFLGKTPVLEKSCTIGDPLLPPIYLEESPVYCTACFPTSGSVKKTIRIKKTKRNSNGKIYHPYMNEEPGNNVYQNRPECR
jgi:hypothetical protein